MLISSGYTLVGSITRNHQPDGPGFTYSYLAGYRPAVFLTAFLHPLRFVLKQGQKSNNILLKARVFTS